MNKMEKMKKLILISAILFNYVIAHSQTITYNKLYEPYHVWESPFIALSILTAGSDKLIAAIGFDTINNNYQSLFFYRIDSVGNASKIISFSRSGYNYYTGINSFIKTRDGGYCCAGDIDTINNPIHFIYRFNSNMDTLWTKHMPQDTIFETIKHFCETSDKGLVFVGNKNVSPYSDQVLLIKTDSLGNQLWKKTIVANNLASGIQILETSDKGFLINGYSGSFTSGQGDPFLMKTDSVGNLSWIKYLGGNQHDSGGSIALTNDGGILYAFGYSTFTYPFNEYYKAYLNIIKFTPNGTEIWNRIYDTIRLDLNANKIQVLPDNDFIVMGSYAERGNDNFYTSYLFKFNANGDSLWRKLYFYTNSNNEQNYLADNLINADGGITACGWVIGDTLVPECQIWILKTDSMGYAPGPQNVGIIDLPYLQLSYGVLKLYPNPATTTIMLSITTALKQGELSIYNMLGIKVMETQLPKGQNAFQLDISQLAKGYYKVILSDYGYIKGEASLLKE